MILFRLDYSVPGTLPVLCFCSMLLYLAACSQSKERKSIHDTRLELPMTEQVMIQRPDTVSAENFVNAEGLQVDDDGNMYIPNDYNKSVHVFSADGDFKFVFGGEGKGPGEFMSFNSFELQNDTLYLFDRNLMRLSKFSRDGKLLGIQKLDGISSSPNMVPFGKEWFFAYAGSYGEDVSGVHLVHRLDESFSPTGEHFVKVNEVNKGLEDINHMVVNSKRSVLPITDSRLLFAPEYYNGILFEYARSESGTWEQVAAHRGYTETKPVSLIEESDQRDPDVIHFSIYLSKPLRLIVHNWSMGIFRVDGHIVHFTAVEHGNKRTFGAEIYDPEMNPVGYAPLKTVSIDDEERMRIGLHWKILDDDGNGNFYLLDRMSDETLVRRLEIDFSSLQ